MGDIIARNKITNAAGIRVLVRKMAESVCRPISYNRINNLLSSVGGKLSLATTIKYVEYCEEAWLLLRLRNYASALADGRYGLVEVKLGGDKLGVDALN